MKHMNYIAGTLLVVGFAGLMNAAPARTLTIKNTASSFADVVLNDLRFDVNPSKNIVEGKEIKVNEERVITVPEGARWFTVQAVGPWLDNPKSIYVVNPQWGNYEPQHIKIADTSMNVRIGPWGTANRLACWQRGSNEETLCETAS